MATASKRIRKTVRYPRAVFRAVAKAARRRGKSFADHVRDVLWRDAQKRLRGGQS